MAKYGVDNLEPRVNRALSSYNQQGIYGYNWSVADSTDALLRVGTRSEVSDGGIMQLLWELVAPEEILLTPGEGNLIDTISSTSGADIGRILLIEGGEYQANGDLTRVSQTVVLDGQNKVTLTNPLCRSCVVQVVDGLPLDGDVYLYQDGPINGGVPDDFTTISAVILGSEGSHRSEKAQCFVPTGESLIVLGILAGVTGDKAGWVEMELEIKNVASGKWNATASSITLHTTGLPQLLIEPSVLGVIPPGNDIRLVAHSQKGDVKASAMIMGLFAVQAHQIS